MLRLVAYALAFAAVNGDSDCAMNTKPGTCRQAGCLWSQADRTCGEKVIVCTDFDGTDPGRCERNGCYWKASDKTCSGTPGVVCEDFLADSEGCKGAMCKWIPDDGTCVDPPAPVSEPTPSPKPSGGGGGGGEASDVCSENLTQRPCTGVEHCRWTKAGECVDTGLVPSSGVCPENETQRPCNREAECRWTKTNMCIYRVDEVRQCSDLDGTDPGRCRRAGCYWFASDKTCRDEPGTVCNHFDLNSEGCKALSNCVWDPSDRSCNDLPPTDAPTDPPTEAPVDPTNAPTDPPVAPPTDAPVDPTNAPTDPPVAPPTDAPVDPTNAPTDPPTKEPTAEPTKAPTDEPTKAPTDEPTKAPTDEPTKAPTEEPTKAPTEEPTKAPTDEPTKAPTDEPTKAPTDEPTKAPTDEPTNAPTDPPTEAPVDPTNAPTDPPVAPPTDAPVDPTNAPTDPPVAPPTDAPVDPTNAPTDPPVAPPTDAPVDPTNAPTDPPVAPPTDAPVDPTDAPVELPVTPPTEATVDPTAACGDITDACDCTGICGWSSSNGVCGSAEDSTTDCIECPTMEACDATHCIAAEKCGQYDPMRICQCDTKCHENDNCCPDQGECGTPETCHALTKHRDCKNGVAPAPGCWWQFDTKECITFDELVAKILARPCSENSPPFQCSLNPKCGWYFGEGLVGEGDVTGECMNKDDIPCDNAKTKWNCNLRAPRVRPDRKFANRVTTKKIRCLWDPVLELCLDAKGGPKPCDTFVFKSPCEKNAFRGCEWTGTFCHNVPE